MIIKFDRLDWNAKLGAHDAVEIKGTRVDNGEEWSKKIFANNGEFLKILSEFGSGDNVNFVMKKEGRFWNIDTISAATEEQVNKAKNAGATSYDANPKATNYKAPAKSDKMTKEDWAEKDRITSLRIAKSVAIKLACDNSKVGTKPEALIYEAEKYVPWLLDDKTFDAGKVIDEAMGTNDALDPPSVD